MDFSGKVKGARLLARLRFVRSLGPQALRSVYEQLGAEDRELLEGGSVQPAQWYSGEILRRLDDVIAAKVANGDRAALLVTMGRFGAEASFGQRGALRPYAARHDPHALLQEVPRIHAGLQGAGSRGYVRVGARAAVVRAVKGHHNEGGDCLTHVGWLRRAIELCGGRDVQVLETACVERGGSCCEFRCEWR